MCSVILSVGNLQITLFSVARVACQLLHHNILTTIFSAVQCQQSFIVVKINQRNPTGAQVPVHSCVLITERGQFPRSLLPQLVLMFRLHASEIKVKFCVWTCDVNQASSYR